MRRNPADTVGRTKRPKKLPEGMARSFADVRRDALARADANPNRYFASIRDEVQAGTAPRDATGRRARFYLRFRGDGGPPHPNKLAALEAFRWDTVFGGPRSPRLRYCARVRRDGSTCRAPAVRGSRFCRHHGGASVAEERRRATFRDYRPDRTLLTCSILRQLARSGRIPDVLLRDVPEFREAFKRARFGVRAQDPLFAEMSYGERRHHHEACAVLTLAYLAAWEAIQVRHDWGPWAECTARAVALGLDRQRAAEAAPWRRGRGG